MQKHLGVKVIWGGTFPTLAPEEAIKYADFVCIGEGDDTLPDLVEALQRGGSFENIPNLMYRTEDDQIQRNPSARLKTDLDELPFPNYFIKGKHFHISKRGKLEPITSGYPRMERSTLRFERNLWMMFGRGCHLTCTYCSVPTLWKQARGLGRFLRFKSPEVMIQEIEWALEQTGGADYIYIMDNDFVVMPEADLQRFCELYREKIKIPFFCYGTPVSITLNKVKFLIKAGVERLDFGIQSGSDRVLKLYKRRATKLHILDAAEAIATAIHEAKSQSTTDQYPTWDLKPYFDVIFNAPFENREDLEETLDVIKRIGKMGFDFGLYCQPLTFFENTALYDQADAGSLGIDVDLHGEKFYAGLSYQEIAEHIIARGNHMYLNTLIYLMRYNHTRFFAGFIPRLLLELMTHKKVVDFFEWANDKPLLKPLLQTTIAWIPTRDRRYFFGRHVRGWWNQITQRLTPPFGKEHLKTTTGIE